MFHQHSSSERKWDGTMFRGVNDSWRTRKGSWHLLWIMLAQDQLITLFLQLFCPALLGCLWKGKIILLQLDTNLLYCSRSHQEGFWQTSWFWTWWWYSRKKVQTFLHKDISFLRVKCPLGLFQAPLNARSLRTDLGGWDREWKEIQVTGKQCRYLPVMSVMLMGRVCPLREPDS